MRKTVNESTFDQEVLRNSRSVLVDFWAEWCTPCQAVAPVLERIANEHNLKLVEVNFDEEQQLAERYGVLSIPNMILFEHGEPKAQAIGAQRKSSLERSLGLAALVRRSHRSTG
jgi:thioredoxin